MACMSVMYSSKGPYALGDICMIEARIGGRIKHQRQILPPFVAPIPIGQWGNHHWVIGIAG